MTDAQDYKRNDSPFQRQPGANRIPPHNDAKRAEERRVGPLEPRPVDAPMARALDKRKSLRDYEDEQNPMPDEADDPAGWEARMRQRLHGALIKKGVENPTNRNDIVREAFGRVRHVEATGERALWAALWWEYRAFNRYKKAFAAQQQLEKDARLWVLEFCSLKTDAEARKMVERAGITDPRLPLLDRLANLSMKAVDARFNGHRQNTKHFAANALDEQVVALWQRVHEVGEARGWNLFERVQKLNQALGNVHSIYAYPGTVEQAAAAFERTWGNEMASNPTAPAKTKENRFAGFFGTFNGICDKNGVPDDDAVRDDLRHKAARKLYNVNSFEELPLDADLGKIITEVKAILAAKPAPSLGDASAEPPALDPVLAEAFPESAAAFAARRGLDKPTDPKPEPATQDTENRNEKATPLNEVPIPGNDGQPIENKALVSNVSTTPMVQPVIVNTEPKACNAWTIVQVNGHELHITAYAGQTSDDVAESVFALLGGLGKVFASERVQSYGTVTDGRDRVMLLKEDGQRLEQPKLSIVARAETGASVPAGQPAQQSGGGRGTVFCSMIKVGISYTGNKPQLQFECDGFNDPLRYTRQNLVEVLRGATNPRTKRAFTSAELVEGTKFSGNFHLDWEKREKDGKMHYDVLAVRDAVEEDAA